MSYSSASVTALLGSQLTSADPIFWSDLRAASISAQTISDVIALSALRQHASRQALPRLAGDTERACRVALVGGYTTYPLSELISHFLATSMPSVNAELFLGDFDNYAAEIMEPGSTLAAFKPDVVVILPSVARCRYEGLLTDPSDMQKAQALATARDVLQLASLANQHTGARVILGNFMLAPSVDPGPYRVRSMGSDWSFRKLVNLSIGADAPSFVTVCDLEFISARRGIANASDDHAWFESKQLGSSEFLVDVAREIAHLVGAPFRAPAKVVVLDLDNTLWGGVIGDDGIDGIVLGDTDPVGEAYKAFQRHVLSFKARGLLLAVSSKNDHEIAAAAFKNHPEMVIRLDDVVSFHANWGPKPDSIRAIAQELGLGLDSFVFIDDNPAEIEHVLQVLPEVHGILLDADPAKRRQQLQDSRLFDVRTLTEEDAQRSAQYQVAAQRQTLQSAANSFDDYLRSLDMTGEINTFRSSDIVRIAQLIARSNQFNLTTIRRQESDLTALMTERGVLPFCMRLRDRFGDYGLIAIIIGRISGPELVVDTWLMSCRVLKRQVEEEVFNELLRLARTHGLTQIRGVFQPTAKNGIVRDLYTTLGFRCVQDGPERREFLIDVATAKPFTTHINIRNLSASAETGNGSPPAELSTAPARALVQPTHSAPVANTVPRNSALARPGIESELAAIWSDALGVPTPGRDANFFDLGGDSLLAMQVHFRLQDRFPDKPLTVTDLIRFPTIAALGAVLGADADEAVDPVADTPRSEPVYFGSSDRLMFGMFHPANSAPARGAVLFCYPMPPKYQLCYGAFKRLAGALAREGLDVLRFDYSGIGDSSGEPTEASIERWGEEVDIALAYLRSRSVAPNVSLVGMRLGAALAALTSARDGKIDRLVLWESVVVGGDYLNELVTMSKAKPTPADALRDGFDFYGFPVMAQLQLGLRAISLIETPPVACRTLLIESTQRPASVALEAMVNGMRCETLPGLGDWDRALKDDQIIVPPAHVQRIIGFLTER